VSPFVIMFQQIEVAARRKNVNGFALGIMSDMNSFANITKN
jgi:peptide/nickel transport system substrate-binding protein